MSKLKISAGACGAVLEKINELPENLEMRSEDFLALVELEEALNAEINKAKAAITKIGYTAEHEALLPNIDPDESNQSDEDREILKRHAKVAGVLEAECEIKKLPKGFVLPQKASRSVLGLFYSLTDKE